MTTNEDILGYLKDTLGEIAKAISSDMGEVSKTIADLAVQVHQATRLSTENKDRLDNIDEETPIALMKQSLGQQGVNWTNISNIVLAVAQAIILFVLFKNIK